MIAWQWNMTACYRLWRATGLKKPFLNVFSMCNISNRGEFSANFSDPDLYSPIRAR